MLPLAKRAPLVIKLGTSLLTDGTRKIARRSILELVRQVAHLHDQGQPIVVVSSGAIAAGREALAYPALDRSLPGKQMLSAVGQGRLFQIYTDLFGIFGITVGQVLLTRGDLNNRLGYLNARDTLQTLLAYRVVPIINENDTIATEEIRVGDNDNLSALVANLIDAELLILLTDQLGLFEADPRTHPEAALIPYVERIDERIWALAGGTSSGLGTGGMVTKLQAAQLATRSGTTTVIAAGKLPNVLIEIAAGKRLGTTFAAQTSRRESRKRWVLAETPIGELVVDDGAAQRLRESGASLLAVGVRAVRGTFERGAPVQVLDLTNRLIAVGIASYGSAEISQLMGVHSTQIANVLGYSYGEEIIHRNDLVLVP